MNKMKKIVDEIKKLVSILEKICLITLCEDCPMKENVCFTDLKYAVNNLMEDGE